MPEPSDYADFGILHRQYTSHDMKMEPVLLGRSFAFRSECFMIFRRSYICYIKWAYMKRNKIIDNLPKQSPNKGKDPKRSSPGIMGGEAKSG